MVVPKALGLYPRRVWTAAVTPSWALALTPWLAAGGRHGLSWYDVEDVRMRFRTNQFEVSGAPATHAMRSHSSDRLAIGFEAHALAHVQAGKVGVAPGGMRDTIATLGYGMEHALGKRWFLGWQLQLRYVWVYRKTQRQARLGLRIAFVPRPPHQLALETVVFGIHRDRNQAGQPLPRASASVGVAGEYAWMSAHKVGVMVRARVTSSFLSGEAPVYEIRAETLNTPYAELVVGPRVVW
jgi:hypothetical protein